MTDRMQDKLTDKQKVQAVWPGAYCRKHPDGIYMVFRPISSEYSECIGYGETRKKAWADAARLIEQQNTKQ